jgi:hypothetical protein
MCRSRYKGPALYAGAAARRGSFSQIIEIVEARIARGQTLAAFA